MTFEEKPESESRAVTDDHEKRGGGRQNMFRRHPFTITWDEDLPICQSRDEIARLIRENQVVIVCGETGSGKSTQLPKICLEIGRGARGLIGHTQPRRIAARSIAQRLAEELHTPLGRGVGYKIRFTDETSDDTFVKIMTDGILLAESQHDPLFRRYDTIIIDEAHERSLNIDFLLGMLKRLLPRRPDLKLIITSATIDAKRFADHFGTTRGPAPVVEVSGRTWPVDILWRSIADYQEEDDDATGPEQEPRERALLDAIDTLAVRDRGDILIFMPTERDIFDAAKLIKQHRIPGDDAARKTEILPLYSRLPGESQQKIFRKSSWRKIVIATNVAESSLTVPGIRYVIDTGTARISRYSSRSKTQRLPVEAISRASADQRAGRCGRTGPGVCIRLYSREDYESRDAYTTPEIRRTNLASVILQTRVMRLGDVERFPFIDPPLRAAVEDGYKTLYELGALDEDRRLTDMGRKLSRLPVDPRIARIIYAGADEQVLREVLIIASVLEIQDPRERPREQEKKADTAHEQFTDENSDFISYLKLWDFWQGLKGSLSGSQLRKACKTNFLSWSRMKEWSDLHVQLMQLAREAGLKPGPRQENPDAVTRSILTGLLYAVARRTETPEYLVTGGGKFFLWPGSGLFRKKYEWVVASERVETTRRYLRTVGKINPDWIEPLAGHLLEKTYSDPHWLRETGCVHAYEKVSLYGLAIIPKRRVNFGPLDPVRARQLFIQGALVDGEFDCRLDFWQKNGETLATAKKLQAKLRQYDLLAELDRLYDFYDRHLPDTVYDSASLERWYRRRTPDERKQLLLSLDDICTRSIDSAVSRQYPDSLDTLSGSSLPLDYQFVPGEVEDGVSVVTAKEGIGQIDAQQIGWLVPGLVEQKVIAALKSLPKEIRRELVPIPDTARLLTGKLEFGQGNFFQALARAVTPLAGRRVVPDDFDQERIPTELVMNIRVVNRKGETLERSRDLATLREKYGGTSRPALASRRDPQWHRDELTRWDFGTLPGGITRTQGTARFTVWPGLVDPRCVEDWSKEEKKKYFPTSAAVPPFICLRLFDTELAATAATRLALTHLFQVENHATLKTQVRWLPNRDRLSILSQGLAHFPFDLAVEELVSRRALDPDETLAVHNEGEYNRAMKAGRDRIGNAVQEVTSWLSPFLESHHAARLILEKGRKGPQAAAVADAEQALARLLIPWFHLRTPWSHLKDFPRYLKALFIRFERWNSGGARQDSVGVGELTQYQTVYEELAARILGAGLQDPRLDTLRWMIEEYRVSLFAQKLGTSMKVSAVRLDRLIEELRQI